METATATIRNKHGIHCRPSTTIVTEMKDYPGEVLLTVESGSADLRSTLDLMLLGLSPGTKVIVQVSGPEEAAYCRKVVELLERDYDFEPADGT